MRQDTQWHGIASQWGPVGGWVPVVHSGDLRHCHWGNGGTTSGDSVLQVPGRSAQAHCTEVAVASDLKLKYQIMSANPTLEPYENALL